MSDIVTTLMVQSCNLQQNMNHLLHADFTNSGTETDKDPTFTDFEVCDCKYIIVAY